MKDVEQNVLLLVKDAPVNGNGKDIYVNNTIDFMEIIMELVPQIG